MKGREGSYSDKELLRRDELKSSQFSHKQPAKDVYALKLSSAVESFEERAILNLTIRGKIRIGPMHVLVSVIALAAVVALGFTYQFSKNQALEKQIADAEKQNRFLVKQQEIVMAELQALRLAVASLYRQGVVDDADTYSEFKDKSSSASRLRRSPASSQNSSDRGYYESVREHEYNPRKHTPIIRRLPEPMSIHLLPNFPHFRTKEERHVIGPWGVDHNETGKPYKQFLGVHGDEVKIKQSGLYLVYAQVEVVIVPHKLSPTDSKSSDEPPSFQIWVKNNHSGARNSTVRTIAECIPAFPHTTHQTCFTMTAAQLEAGDIVSLRSPATTTSNVTVYTNGTSRTFFGFVKLGQS